MQAPETLSFLYTDIVGSTRLWDDHPTEMAMVMAAHNERIEEAVRQFGGSVFKSLGDGLACVFPAADDAIQCAQQLQEAFLEPVAGMLLKLRMGIHSGAAQRLGSDYAGPALNRVSRITDLAEGGQVLISEAACLLAVDRMPSLQLVRVGEAALEGMSRPERLFALSALGTPILASPGFPIGRLEALDTPFVGRAQEREELGERLRQGRQRLITAAGFGGMGKTTLARQCAWDVLDHFDNRVLWVDCEAVRSESELSDLLQDSLSASGEEAVARALQERCLIVFDCFEGALSAAGLVERLLRRCPLLQALVTSRVVLGLAAEHLLELGAMTKGQEGDSLALFVSEARKHTPEFGLRKGDKKTAAELAALAEHVPLGIVLLAGRLRHTPAEQLAAEAKTSRLAAVRSPRAGETRHAGLHVVIRMSFDALRPSDQSALQRLSVFEGGFCPPFAQALLESDGAEVHALRDHSLLSVMAGSRDRLHLLDSVREFCWDRMGEAALTQARRDHARLCLAEARAIQELFGKDWTAAAARFRAELANIRAAGRFALSDVQAELGADAAPAARLMLEAGHFDELSAFADAGIEHARSEGLPRLALELGGLKAFGYRRKGQYRLAQAALSEKLQFAREVGDQEAVWETLGDQASIALMEGDDAAASEALALLAAEPKGGDSEKMLATMTAVLAACNGHEADARAGVARTLAFLEAEPSAQGRSFFRSMVTRAYVLLQDWPAAEQAAANGVREAEATGYLPVLAQRCLTYAEICSATGDGERLRLALRLLASLPRAASGIYGVRGAELAARSGLELTAGRSWQASSRALLAKL